MEEGSGSNSVYKWITKVEQKLGIVIEKIPPKRPARKRTRKSHNDSESESNKGVETVEDLLLL
jgi:hypothetical protein